MTFKADDPLRQPLADLEGYGASDGFTERVLESLAIRKVQRRRRQRLVLTSLGIAILVTAIGLLSPNIPGDPTRAELTEEAQVLKRESEALQTEIDALRASARDSAPVLYLGGDDEMDLVLDLAPIISQSAPASLPASSANVDPYEL